MKGLVNQLCTFSYFADIIYMQTVLTWLETWSEFKLFYTDGNPKRILNKK